MKNLEKIILVILLSALIFGCSEDDSIQLNQDVTQDVIYSESINDYFDIYFIYENNEHINIANSAKTSIPENIIQNMKNYFESNNLEVSRMTENIGYPLWQDAYLDEKDGIVSIMLPATRLTSHRVDGMIYFIRDVKNSTSYLEYVNRNDYSENDLYVLNNSPTRTMIFNRESIFYPTISIDRTLFNYVDESLVHEFSEFVEIEKLDSYKNCIVTYTPNTTWSRVCVGRVGEENPHCYWEVSTTWTRTEDCDSSGGSQTGGSGNDNGNQSGGSTSSPEETIIDDTTTPCASSVVRDIRNNRFAHSFVEMINEIFDVDGDVNITIKEARLSSSKDAQWESDGVRGDASSDIFFLDGTITINDRYTPNATEDWILVTIMHELVHGFIDYQRGRLSAGFITQSEFNSMFPLYSSSGNNQHVVMANQYINTMKEILKRNNLTLSNREALALSRVGLQDASAYWSSLSTSEKNDSAVYNEIGRGTRSPSSSFPSKQKDCN